MLSLKRWRQQERRPTDSFPRTLACLLAPVLHNCGPAPTVVAQTNRYDVTDDDDLLLSLTACTGSSGNGSYKRSRRGVVVCLE